MEQKQQMAPANKVAVLSPSPPLVHSTSATTRPHSDEPIKRLHDNMHASSRSQRLPTNMAGSAIKSSLNTRPGEPCLLGFNPLQIQNVSNSIPKVSRLKALAPLWLPVPFRVGIHRALPLISSRFATSSLCDNSSRAHTASLWAALPG